MLPLLVMLGSLWLPPACTTGFCDCFPPGTVAETRDAAAAVFSGTVVRTHRAMFLRPRGKRVITFRVDRAWKGVDSRTVRVVTGWGGGDCGYPFETGQRYLVYASSEARGEALWANICSRTAALSAAGEDLRALGRPARTWPASPRNR